MIMNGDGQVKIASGLNVLLGLWLIVASFILGYSEFNTAQWNEIIVGAVVLILAAIRFWQPDEWSWLSWVNAALGVWFVVAPFILGYNEVTAALWNDIIVGIAIIVLAAWSAIATPDTEVITQGTH
jgi:hypothetical protein